MSIFLWSALILLYFSRASTRLLRVVKLVGIASLVAVAFWVLSLMLTFVEQPDEQQQSLFEERYNVEVVSDVRWLLGWADGQEWSETVTLKDRDTGVSYDVLLRKSVDVEAELIDFSISSPPAAGTQGAAISSESLSEIGLVVDSGLGEKSK